METKVAGDEAEDRSQLGNEWVKLRYTEMPVLLLQGV